MAPTLLTVPLEIRLKVYKYVFNNKRCILEDRRVKTIHNSTRNEREAYEIPERELVAYPTLPDDLDHWRPTSILYTCSQVYRETRSCLITNARFHFNVAYDDATACYYPKRSRLPHAVVQKIQQLEIFVDRCEHKLPSCRIADIINNLVGVLYNLRSLDLIFQVMDQHPYYSAHSGALAEDNEAWMRAVLNDE